MPSQAKKMYSNEPQVNLNHVLRQLSLISYSTLISILLTWENLEMGWGKCCRNSFNFATSTKSFWTLFGLKLPYHRMGPSRIGIRVHELYPSYTQERGGYLFPAYRADTVHVPVYQFR